MAAETLQFDLTEPQQMLRKMVRDLADRHIAPLPAGIDENEEVPDSVLELSPVAHESEQRGRQRDEPDQEEPGVQVDQHADGADQPDHLPEP